MSAPLKKVLIAIGALVLILVIAAIVLVATFDANRYKSVAIDWMKTHRNRTLAIDGPVELSVFPRLAVKLSGVKLSEAGRAETFAAIDAAALSVELWPLLRKQLVVDRVEASGVQATLTRDAKGRRNLDDLLGPAGEAAAPAAPAASAPGGTALRFDVSRIALRDVQLLLRDQPAALDGELRIASLTTGRIASGVATPVALDARFDFKSPLLKGDLRAEAKLTPDLDTGAVVAADVALAWSGTVPGGLTLKTATLDAKRLAYDPGQRSIAVEALKLRAQGDQGGAALKAELDWPQLEARGERLQGSGVQGRFERGGPAAVQATLKTAAPEGSFDALRIPGLDVQWSAQAGGRKLEGTVRGQLSVQAPGKTAQWTLNGRAAGNAFETNGSLAWGAAVPTLRAQMRFDALDLDTLLPPPAAAAASASGTAPSADVPIDLAPLRAVNGSVNLRAARLKVRQIQLAETRLDATLEAGMLRMPTLSAKAWGGQVDASGSADAKSQRVALKAEAAGIDIDALLKQLAGRDLLEGRGRVALDVNTGGRTLGAMRSGLGGTATLQLRDGAVKGINLARTFRQAKAALNDRDDAVQRASQTEKTDFSELSASFGIVGGVARNTDLELKSPFLRLGGDGAVDIGRSRIDYTARATVVSTATGQDAGDLQALKGLTIPVRLTGPLEAIEWKVQWSAVAASALKGKAEEKLKQKLGAKLGESLGAPESAASSPKQQLKEKLLKGLFK